MLKKIVMFATGKEHEQKIKSVRATRDSKQEVKVEKGIDAIKIETLLKDVLFSKGIIDISQWLVKNGYVNKTVKLGNTVVPFVKTITELKEKVEGKKATKRDISNYYQLFEIYKQGVYEAIEDQKFKRFIAKIMIKYAPEDLAQALFSGNDKAIEKAQRVFKVWSYKQLCAHYRKLANEYCRKANMPVCQEELEVKRLKKTIRAIQTQTQEPTKPYASDLQEQLDQTRASYEIVEPSAMYEPQDEWLVYNDTMMGIDYDSEYYGATGAYNQLPELKSVIYSFKDYDYDTEIGATSYDFLIRDLKYLDRELYKRASGDFFLAEGDKQTDSNTDKDKDKDKDEGIPKPCRGLTGRRLYRCIKRFDPNRIERTKSILDGIANIVGAFTPILGGLIGGQATYDPYRDTGYYNYPDAGGRQDYGSGYNYGGGYQQQNQQQGQQQDKSNTGLYIGLGIAGIAVIGALLYFVSRKK